MNDLLTINGISASYQDEEILHKVDLSIHEGRILGLVGESGSGKSTLARVITGLLKPTEGTMTFMGKSYTPGNRRMRSEAGRIQMVFQNPQGSLNPKHTVGKIITDAMLFHHICEPGKAEQECRKLIERMQLPSDTYQRYPDSFSGGQKQRIALLRAISVKPKLLIADEPTSALDVSVQLEILNLLLDLKKELDLTILFISHDLGVIHYLCDEIAVMKDGQVMEVGEKTAFFRSPASEYGRLLLKSVPKIS